MEQSEVIEEERLKAIAEALGLITEIIRRSKEETLFTNIQHNSDTSSHNLIVN
jgi:hypothetical protein